MSIEKNEKDVKYLNESDEKLSSPSKKTKFINKAEKFLMSPTNSSSSQTSSKSGLGKKRSFNSSFLQSENDLTLQKNLKINNLKQPERSQNANRKLFPQQSEQLQTKQEFQNTLNESEKLENCKKKRERKPPGFYANDPINRLPLPKKTKTPKKNTSVLKPVSLSNVNTPTKTPNKNNCKKASTVTPSHSISSNLNFYDENTPSKSLTKKFNKIDLKNEDIKKYKIGEISINLNAKKFSEFSQQELYNNDVLLDFDNEEYDDEKLNLMSASPTPVAVKFKSKLCQKSALYEAKACLHTSTVPEILIKREKEYQQIYNFVLDGVKYKKSQALYISGVPGTGKTACVTKVIEDIKKNQKNLNFNFVPINALELTNPKRLFCVICKNILPKCPTKISTTNAHQKLNEFFLKINPNKKPVVLLIDEVDMLFTKRQEIVYTIFNWSATEGSMVNVIAISNTLDLPERTLSQRVASRLGSKRLCFQPYNHEELTEIIKHRLSNCSAVQQDAIELAARKVASLSGDLRKALELLQRAIDIAIEQATVKQENLKDVRLNFAHVNQAMQEAVSSICIDYISTMTIHEEFLLRSLVNDLQKSNLEETIFYRLFQEYKQMCFSKNVLPLSSISIFHILMELANLNFISLSTDNGQMNRRIALNIPLSETIFCIRQLDLKEGNLTK